MLPHKNSESALQTAVRAVLPDADASAVLVRPCPDPKFGDYQSNALMSLAKTRKMNPRQLATDVLAKFDVSEVCEKVEIAGAGFLNFRLKNAALTDASSNAFTKSSTPSAMPIPRVSKPPSQNWSNSRPAIPRIPPSGRK